MTVVLKIAVLDGVVMGSDSRSVLMRSDKRPQVFDGIQKIYILHKDFPAAVMTWGLNRLNDVTIEHLMQDVRTRLEGRDPEHLDWKLDTAATTIPELAEKVVNHLFHDHYQKVKDLNPAFSAMNFNFAGYSPGKSTPEHVEYSFTPDHMIGPTVAAGSVQVNYSGGPYLSRAMSGSDPSLIKKLIDAGADKKVVETTLKELGTVSLRELVPAGIPLHEVAGLVRSLLNTEINLRRLGPEPDTVGGDIQMVVIDRQGCREMRFRPISFDIPQNIWKRR